jgi:translation initiation factor IF-2
LIKLRVHDLAGEFGVSSDELMSLLRQMDVPVRSHLSQLSDDQVARLRARWEREKRARQEKPATATATRRRRGVVAPPPPPAPVPEAADAGAPKRRRRKAADVAAAAEAQAAADAQAEADAAEAEATGVEVEPFAPPPPPDERRPEPFRELTPERTPAVEPRERFRRPEQEAPAEQRTHVERPAVERPAASAPGSPTATPSPSRPTSGSDWSRPRPVVPGPPRPKPIASGSPYTTPRPIASAAPGAGTAPPRRDDKKGAKRKKGKRGTVDQEAVAANISKTMSALRGVHGRRGGPRQREDGTSREEMEAMRAAAAERERKTVRVNEFITVSELADILKIPATQIVAFAFKNLGLMVTINQRMDFDQIELIAGEFGFQAVREQEYQAESTEEAEEDREEDRRTRPPVVTIMGHVDHGKTSLLDYIRKANVVAGEAGGITQHIGAYQVTLPNGRELTFLDTPGHQAFTAMRARGAQVTDIVVLVVAADDSVMPQTVEAISHAKNAGVPVVVAVNKIDLPGANPAKVTQELLEHGIVVEQFGGSTLSTPISAKKGTNVTELLDQILLQAELLDLKANPDKRAIGTVVEAQLDPGKGPVATVLVQNGTLHVGDDFICGMYSGRVRALHDERGRHVKDAGPGTPVQVLGFEGVPQAGDQFLVVTDAADAREIAQKRQRLEREAKSRRTSKGGMSLEDFMSKAASGEKRALRLVIKADQGGPAEALADALGQLSNEEVSVEVVHRGVGAVTEGDILLAKASGAIIIGFHVRPDNNARAAAEREGVEIKLYRIIYEAVNDVRAALEGLLRPEEREVILGEAEVRETFKVPKFGVIAGCFVRSGTITRQGRARVIRDGVVAYEGTIGSLRRFKDDVREVRDGFECGIGIDNFNDIKVGDVIESYRTEEISRTLAASTS